MKPSSYLISFEKYAHKCLIKEYKELIHINYNSLVLNNLLSNGKCHIVSLFKDYLILDETADFFIRFYPKNRSILKLKQLFNYYEESSFIFPNYTPLKESKYIYKNIMRKQRVIDEQENLDEIKQQREKKKKKVTNKISLNNLYNQDSFDEKFFNSSVYNSVFNGSQSLLRIVFGIDKNKKNKKEKEKEKETINKNESIEPSSLESEYNNLNDENFIKNSNLDKDAYDSDTSEIKDIVKNIKKNEKKIMKNNLIENENNNNKFKIKYGNNVKNINKIKIIKENFKKYFKNPYEDSSINFRNKNNNTNFFSINSSDSNLTLTNNFIKGYNNISKVKNLSKNKKAYYLSNKTQETFSSTNNSSRNYNIKKNNLSNKSLKTKHRKINTALFNINSGELDNILTKFSTNGNKDNKQIQINNNIFINEINLFNKSKMSMTTKTKIINNNFPKIINKADKPQLKTNPNNKTKNAFDFIPLSYRNAKNVININEMNNILKNRSVNKKEKNMENKLKVHGLQLSGLVQNNFKRKIKKNSDNFEINFANKIKDFNVFNKKHKSTSKNKTKYNLNAKLGLGENNPSVKIKRKNGFLTDRQTNKMKFK